MFELIVYKPTPGGLAELKSGKMSVSALATQVLIRMDGIQNVGQIKASMSDVNATTFNEACNELLNHKMIALAEIDLFADTFQLELDKQVLSLSSTEADVGAASLKKFGFFVNIAHKRSNLQRRTAGSPLTAVVVEDEPFLAKFIGSYLTIEGFTVRVASNRNEVLNELRTLPVPDLILLDVVLPDIDGFNILLRLRQHPAFTAVPIIMLTGLATREDVLKGLSGGADGYVTKPFEADILMQAVRTVMGNI
jgi:two-component system, OmpR family, response regulator